jgi:hypothetical protein
MTVKSLITLMTGINVLKLFMAISYKISGVFIPCTPFQDSILFVGEAKSQPYSGKPEKCLCFILVGSCLTCKH